MPAYIVFTQTKTLDPKEPGIYWAGIRDGRFTKALSLKAWLSLDSNGIDSCGGPRLEMRDDYP